MDTPAFPQARHCMFFTLVLCAAALAACGGGADGSAEAPAATAGIAAAPTFELTGDGAVQAARVATTASVLAATPRPVDALGDALTPNPALAPANSLHALNQSVGDANAGLRALGRTALCREGFIVPRDLVRSASAPLPAAGKGVFFNAVELANWRARAKSGPFIKDGDFAPGSPGDWSRIQANAKAFVAHGEPLAAPDDAARAAHGQLARDAAFVYLIAPDARLLVAVRQYLVQQAAASVNDFVSTRCYTAADGASRDGYFAEAPWLARFIASYDFVRAVLPVSERVLIENYIRRNAWFFATQLDWGLRNIFPQRLQGNYGVRDADAAASGEAAWFMRRVDTNGDCVADERDDAQRWPTYAYARADGTLGPRVSMLAMWFNNRRAANALAMASAGVLLGDGELVVRAKRYVMEWLAYAVWGDGSVGEYARNGEYCIARQGLIYSSLSIQTGLMTARMLARQGDRSLANFASSDGLFGTAVASGAAPKSLALVTDTYLRAASGELGWYRAEPQLAVQQPRAQTDLSRTELHYMGSATAMDDLHELAFLSSAAIVPTVPVARALLQHKLITQAPTLPRPVVATGLGAWTDAFAVLPAGYLLRP